MEREPVKSGNIKSIGYDNNTRIMEVEFQNGSVYQYAKVSYELYNHIFYAPSVGKAFYKNIRNRADKYKPVRVS